MHIAAEIQLVERIVAERQVGKGIAVRENAD